MKIIDAHMHYYNVDGFVQVAANAGYEIQQPAGRRYAKKTISSFL